MNERAPTVGSICSGIGGFDLGFERAGFRILWQIEIDPFCLAVLARHWPHVRQIWNLFTCEPSKPSTSSSPGSPVNPSVIRDTDAAPTMNDGSGPPRSEPFALYVRGSSFWKTSAGSPDGRSERFSETWPKSGTTRNGRAYAHRVWAAPRTASGSMCWPTLTASAGREVTRNLSYFQRRANSIGAMSVPAATALRTHDRTRRGFYGRLNPEWVEWLMGFPIGWTELEDSATRLFPTSRNGSPGGSDDQGS